MWTNSSSSSMNSRDEDRNKEASSSPPSIDSRFNQTLRNVQGLLKGRSFPGKILISRRSDPLDPSILHSPSIDRRSQESDRDHSEQLDRSSEDELQNRSSANASSSVNHTKSSSTSSQSTSKDLPKSNVGARATDSAKLMKFTKELSGSSVILEKLRELAWSGVPPYLRPTVWRLLLEMEHGPRTVAYSPIYSDGLRSPYHKMVLLKGIDAESQLPSGNLEQKLQKMYRREGVLRRKRMEYLDHVAQYYDVPDTQRTDEEITMLRQIAVDCPRTVPDLSFFQQVEVQKSLERILYTWAIRHPASGYVQGINDLATPFLVVFLSEYLEGSIETWAMADLSREKILNVEADSYWCLSKLLDGMQDHYTFAQPGIQRLVFKLKELVRRIDEPVLKHIEEQGLDFLQFAFRWFNCLLIREIPFCLVTRLWDTYLAEGDSLPDFLVYISASFLLTWSDKLRKLDFQEMVMFLQHLPTHNWSDVELEMVLSQAYMWHSMFNNSPSHLAG